MGVTTLSAGDTPHGGIRETIWLTTESRQRGDHGSLGQQLVLDGSQRVVDPDEVLLAVLFQDQGVEVQADPVARLGPQQPLQFDVGRVGRVWEARRLDHTLLADVDVEGLLH